MRMIEILKCRSALLAVSTILLLSACGDSSQSDKQNGVTGSVAVAPPPPNSEVRSFLGSRNQYQIVRTSAGFVIKSIAGAQSETFLPIQSIAQFSDMAINLGIGEQSKRISSTDLRMLIELYIAFFNRVPESNGMVYWINQIQEGKTILEIADSFYAAAIQYAELTSYSATMSDADFVRIVYKNVLGRSEVDSEGLSYWTNALALKPGTKGAETRGTLVRTIITAAHGFKGKADYGWVADLLDNKIVVGRYFAIEQGISYLTDVESIKKGMQIAELVTANSSAAAKAHIAISDTIDLSLQFDIGSVKELVWPNVENSSNSSAWLRGNHERLTRIEPKVLVLDVVQGGKWTTDITSLTTGLTDAFAAMSQYRGYLDANAQPFLNYKIDKIVDLRDPRGAEYPSFWPRRSANGFDIGELFSESFAARLGYRDPNNSSRFLPMCEIFERGLVNELWIAAGDRNVYENQSYLQLYDEQLQPKSGEFLSCTNGCFYDPGRRVNCTVSVRMMEINKSRGVGCGTHAAGHAFERLVETNPYLRENASRFFNFDLNQRFGFSFTNTYLCSYTDGKICLDFPNASTISAGANFPGNAFRSETWGQGCGNVHFAPNSRFHYDYYEKQLGVQNSCEAYALGANTGLDATSIYTAKKVAAYEERFGDCGGGWQIYMGQSMPGAFNPALDTRKQAMKNWWPFLFY